MNRRCRIQFSIHSDVWWPFLATYRRPWESAGQLLDQLVKDWPKGVPSVEMSGRSDLTINTTVHPDTLQLIETAAQHFGISKGAVVTWLIQERGKRDESS